MHKSLLSRSTMKTPTRLFAPLALASTLLGANVAHAQTYTPSNRFPVADNTQIGTQVSGSNNNFNITGGLRRGQTLFHSFGDFSVPTSGQANFANPVGNRDIITRVTGGLFSDINGTVSTQGANFFLINPNGVVFGPNAQLNVGKAFVGSTANSIDLVDGSGRTITFGANANGDAPLLSINPNVFFNVSRLNMGGGTGSISNFGTLQTPNNSQYIGLIGGNVTLDGSQGGGKIIAPGGRVDIGGLSGAGSVTVNNNGLVFSGEGLRSDVSLINGAGITVRASGTLDTVNTFFGNVTAPGSSINISANHLDLLNAGANSSTQPAAIDAGLETNSGVKTIAAGDIKIDATGKVNLNNSNIKNTLRDGAEGTIGGIKIQAGDLDINHNSGISTAIGGKGNGGNIDIKTTGGINLTDNSYVSSDNALPITQGNAGDINIQATGDIKISGYNVLSANPTASSISSDTYGQGDTGKITIDTQGKLSIINNGNISNIIHSTAVSNGKGIRIAARELELANNSYISTLTFQGTQVNGKGTAGDIKIDTTGDIKVSGYDPLSSTIPTLSYISSDTQGYGDTGKVTINTQGKLSVINYASISSNIGSTAVGNSKGLNITARELKLAKNSSITTSSLTNTQGNTGDIKIATTGDIQISGYDSSVPNPPKSDLSFINSGNNGRGDAGKITIDTQGKLSVVNRGNISSTIGQTAVGNSKGISITARELELANSGFILTNTLQSNLVDSKGNAGDIAIKTTGDIQISGYDSSATNPITSDVSQISSSTTGRGDAGEIKIDTQGKLSILNNGNINSAVFKTAIGNSKGISITARELELANNAYIITVAFQTDRVDGKGNAGDIAIKTTGDIKISGSDSSSTNPTFPQIASSTFGQGDAGKITIDTQGKLSLNQGTISAAIGKTAVGNSKGIRITAREVELNNSSLIFTDTDQTARVSGTGKSGDIELQVQGAVSVNNISVISTKSTGVGEAGNVSLSASRVLFDRGGILSNADSASGGNVTIAISDRLLLRNGGSIVTNSGSKDKNGNGGNITISSPLIIAVPGNNDITANAYQGAGGNINITSQGLFGIQYRPKGQDSPFTNDITASSTFGQNGNVNISTPGTDPGKNLGVLPVVTDDASKQISQVCSDSQRANKFYIIGKGGHPQSAVDPLNNDVVWHDPRGVKSQSVAANPSSQTIRKFAPPAIGWVFDGKGKVTLVSALDEVPVGTKVLCPKQGK